MFTAAELNPPGSCTVMTAAELNAWARGGAPRFHFPTKGPLGCDWTPNIWQPVHYGWQEGWQEFFAGPFEWLGGPPPMIVIYPSLTPFDSANPSSEILQGTYPLIAFAHGNCGTKESGYNYDIYKSWIDTLAPLARAGYVVVIPKLPPVDLNLQPPANSEQDVHDAEATLRLLSDKLSTAIDWVLQESPFKGSTDSMKIGLAGHREGAYAAALLTTGTDGVSKYPNVQAYASLSGYFLALAEFRLNLHDDQFFLEELQKLTVPRLFVIGAQGTSGENGAPDDTINAVNAIGVFDWDGIVRYTQARGGHGVVFNGGHVYDYLNVDAKSVTPATPEDLQGLQSWKNGAPTICDVVEQTQGAGACPVQQWLLARDILTTFFSYYMPPTTLPSPLAHTLVPPGSEDLSWLNGQLVNKGLPKECAAAQAAVWKPQGSIFSGANYMNGAAAFSADQAAHCIATFAWQTKAYSFGRLQLGPGSGSAMSALVDTGHTTAFPATWGGRTKVLPVLPQGGLFICHDIYGYYAMSSIFTHQQCDLAFFGNFICDDSFIHCKCHDSLYNLNGKKVGGERDPNVPIDANSSDPEIQQLASCPQKPSSGTGPAEFDLQHYAVVIDNGKLLIDLWEPVDSGNRYK